jgi:hypothetical protein
LEVVHKIKKPPNIYENCLWKFSRTETTGYFLKSNNRITLVWTLVLTWIFLLVPCWVFCPSPKNLDIKGMTEDGVRPLLEVFLLIEVPQSQVSRWSGGINKWRLPSYPYPQATRLECTLLQLESRVQHVGYHVPIGKFLPQRIFGPARVNQYLCWYLHLLLQWGLGATTFNQGNIKFALEDHDLNLVF